MIKEFEFYHGAAIMKLLHESKQPVTVRSYTMSNNASYVINNNTGLYIKHSGKRMSPWSFILHKDHQDEILQMRKKFERIFLLLICGDDGIVTLSYEEIKKILDEVREPLEWISVARTRRSQYTVKGSNGYLEYKISKSDFPKKIFER